MFYAYSQMGEALREIHGIPLQSFGYIGLDGVWMPHVSIALRCRFSSTTS